jgi:hypothetical protein
MNSLLPSPLIADIDGVIGAVVTLGALMLWIIQKIVEANKSAQAPARRAQGPRPQAAPPAAAAGQQADPLRNQVEEFLRRAQGNQPAQRGPQPQRVPAPGARDIELLVDEQTPRSQRPVGTPLRAGVERFGEAARAAGPDARPARRPVTPRKRKTLAEKADERAAARASSIAQQASSLGRRIIAEDQQFDQQLKSKFDHTVGTLASETATEVALVPVARETPAAQIAAMLSNPEGVRQAIVLNEVLRRPTDRW